MVEVHGNRNTEFCTKCGFEYYRDFGCRTATKANQHETVRFCEKKTCGAKLKDSWINFGDQLEPHVLQKAVEAHSKSDLCLIMGSSMRVSPANTWPLITAD